MSCSFDLMRSCKSTTLSGMFMPAFSDKFVKYCLTRLLIFVSCSTNTVPLYLSDFNLYFLTMLETTGADASKCLFVSLKNATSASFPFKSKFFLSADLMASPPLITCKLTGFAFEPVFFLILSNKPITVLPIATIKVFISRSSRLAGRIRALNFASTTAFFKTSSSIEYILYAFHVSNLPASFPLTSPLVTHVNCMVFSSGSRPEYFFCASLRFLNTSTPPPSPVILPFLTPTT